MSKPSLGTSRNLPDVFVKLGCVIYICVYVHTIVCVFILYNAKCII